ncbi:hypothetical protein H0A71_18885 [Alcaligenaceae bacterium]|nr:hypothetical protein [Alcaligenaceae bacterium]
MDDIHVWLGCLNTAHALFLKEHGDLLINLLTDLCILQWLARAVQLVVPILGFIMLILGFWLARGLSLIVER